MKFNFFLRKKISGRKRSRRQMAGFEQEQINDYGRQQLKSLIDRGLSVQWQ